MTHHIVIPRSKDPKLVTARCDCGQWAMGYSTTVEQRQVIAAAENHMMLSNGGPFFRVDDGDGAVTFGNQPNI